MKNEILYVLLPDFAEHEIAYLAEAINCDAQGFKAEPKYVNRIVAADMEPVRSCGGFRVLPDYSFETMPEEYAALVLIGGFGWKTSLAEQVVPLVKDAVAHGRVVGGICNGASFLAANGFLNNVRHTGTGLGQLRHWGGANYTREHNYVHEQAVSDGGIVTANGSAALEFARELLLLLENDTAEAIEMYYQFNKAGFCALFPGRTDDTGKE